MAFVTIVTILTREFCRMSTLSLAVPKGTPFKEFCEKNHINKLAVGLKFERVFKMTVGKDQVRSVESEIAAGGLDYRPAFIGRRGCD